MVTFSGALLIAPAKRMAGGMGKQQFVMMEVRTWSPLTLPSAGGLHPGNAWALKLSYISAAGYCPNPGIPIGTRKVGSQYRLEDIVTYHCSRGLVLRGSQKRKCQEGGSWSGTEPSCQGDP